MTIEELRQLEKELAERRVQLGEFLAIPKREEELAALEAKMNAPDFWNDKEAAQATVAALSSCRNVLEPYRKLASGLDDLSAALELAESEPEFLSECEDEAKQLAAAMDKLEVVSFLSGKFDRNNFYLSIHAGAGGTESCD